jgi:hypothetical protein
VGWGLKGVAPYNPPPLVLRCKSAKDVHGPRPPEQFATGARSLSAKSTVAKQNCCGVASGLPDSLEPQCAHRRQATMAIRADDAQSSVGERTPLPTAMTVG